MTKTKERPQQEMRDQKTETKKPGFFDLLSEDDSPEIGIASKEPLGEYFQGVKYEFKRIEWPPKSQIGQEFFAVVVIVSIIAAMIFVIDLGLDKFLNLISGGRV